jgi:hypothetical protein
MEESLWVVNFPASQPRIPLTISINLPKPVFEVIASRAGIFFAHF